MSTEEQIQEQEQEQIPEEEALFATANFTETAVLEGHNVAITALQVSHDHEHLVSASRDKSALVWKLPKQYQNWGTEFTRLQGHNHMISGLSLTNDASHLLTSSWDNTIRLWNLQERATRKLFVGHTDDVLDVTFTPDNRRILSLGRDKTVKLWNIHGECKYTLTLTAWPTRIACVSTGNDATTTLIAFGYVDGSVDVRNVSSKFDKLFNLKAHEGRVNDVAFSPDGSFIFTGGADHKLIVWKAENGERVLTFDTKAGINSIAVCPTHSWICAATQAGIEVFDLQERKGIDVVAPAWPKTGKHGKTPDCKAIAWADDGTAMYAGYTDGSIRVWTPKSVAN